MAPYPLGRLGLAPVLSGAPAAQLAVKINIKVTNERKRSSRLFRDGSTVTTQYL